MDKKGVWIVAARVEGKDSFFADSPITEKMLRAMVNAYDPRFRQAPVISPWDPRLSETKGPSHFAGQWGPPLGFIRSLDFDGLNLWAEIDEITDRDGAGLVTQAVAAGMLERSIGWWNETPEIEGNPPYLRHLALLGGENPGVPNMPPLTEYFAASMRSVEAGMLLASAPYSEQSMLDQPEPATSPEPGKKENDQMDETTRAEIGGIVRQAISEVIDVSVAKAMEPVTARVAAMESGLLEVRQATTAAGAQARERAIATELETLVRSGRLRPAERDIEAKTLGALPAELAEERLASLRSRRQMFGGTPGRSAMIDATPDADGAIADVMSARRFTLPNPGGDNVDPESAALFVAARAKAGSDDPAKFRAAVYELAGVSSQEV